MTVVEWAAQAKRGDAFCYFRGDLAHARHEATTTERNCGFAPPALRMRCDEANDAWTLYLHGRVTLIQKRMGASDFSYIAVRR
jgi:hypothetical protein